ncbi:MAG TPA: FlgO family outer membrane protein [Nitrospirota bacterium]|nr:FlgO family outer membrane protein [Nitrospirota bacterium]
MKHTLLALVLMIGTAACATVDQQEHTAAPVQRASSRDLDRQLDALTEQITNSLTVQKTAKIAVIEFTTLEGKVTDLGRYLAEELTTRLFRTGKFQIVERRLMQKMMDEQKLSASGMIDEKTASQFGKILGVDALTTGTITDLNTSVKVNARLIAAGTGSVFAVASVDIPLSREVALLLGKAIADGADRERGRFDGTWSVTIVCPQHTDGAMGYTLEFFAVVKEGNLSGQYGTKGEAPSLTLEGKINGDGSTVLTANGLTGDMKYNIGRARKSTPYSYHVSANFRDSRGTGKRIENRICNLVFVKQ